VPVSVTKNLFFVHNWKKPAEACGFSVENVFEELYKGVLLQF